MLQRVPSITAVPYIMHPDCIHRRNENCKALRRKQAIRNSYPRVHRGCLCTRTACPLTFWVNLYLLNICFKKVSSCWSILRSLKSPPFANMTQTRPHTHRRSNRLDPAEETLLWLSVPRSTHTAHVTEFFFISLAEGHRSCKHLKSRRFSPACCTITFL